MPAIVLTGSGNDTVLDGGSGGSIIVGGGGNDFLEGGSGYNVLIGGAGQSILIGGPPGAPSSGSIMIGGATTFDTGESTLWSLLRNWAVSIPSGQRMANLGGLLNANSIVPNALTDVLYGSTGKDWIWNVSGNDKIVGATS